MRTQLYCRRKQIISKLSFLYKKNGRY